MPCYEMVQEILNCCKNNQMRDVFFREVETDDPVSYVRGLLKGKSVELTPEPLADGGVTVHALCEGLMQKFIFTPVED